MVVCTPQLGSPYPPACPQASPPPRWFCGADCSTPRALPDLWQSSIPAASLAPAHVGRDKPGAQRRNGGAHWQCPSTGLRQPWWVRDTCRNGMEAWWVEPLGGTLELRAGASPALTWFPWLKCEKLIGVQAQHLAELLGVGLRVRGQNEYNITSSKAV